MDFGAFLLFGFVALVFLVYIPVVIFAYFQKNPKLRLHVIIAVLMAAFLLTSGLYIRQVYFLDEPLAIAASLGNIKEVERLLDHGASPDAEGVDGISTALVDASANGYTKIVQMLLVKGADVNQTDSEGKTALMRAIQGNHKDIIQILRDAGAQ